MLLSSPPNRELANFLKKIFFWNYARNTWQWDVLCVLILIFIFLTPKSWFTNSERDRMHVHPKPTSTLLVGPEVVGNEGDRTQIQDRVRSMTGRSDLEVVEVRKLLDRDGRTRGYEVDIR
ncbi:MAG: hypothetical protein ACRD6N_08750 [Pyrinomonadaceae bacterium]